MSGHKNNNKLLLIALGALGVVYGDIGTSPLYAMNEMFFGHAHLSRSAVDVFGGVSLIFWALTLIISFKYMIFVLKADYDGEGGVFALVSLLSKKSLKKLFTAILPLLIFAAGLLYGEGVITPAISVLSAVEGLLIVTPSFKPFVIPITIIILTILFYSQKNGTHKIGKLFGPIVLVWFACISIIGGMHIFQTPEILSAVNPYYAYAFMKSHHVLTVMLALGSVMLVVTGGEAMYADMGHFGAKPIRISWFSVAYPALLLNYFGQGAYLLSGDVILNNNIFFSMVPKLLLIPMILLATAATIIASQALISGAFSLATQAISLNLLPNLQTVHTHEDFEGQRYLPIVNWLIYAGSVTLVLTFQSSTRLASAYGLSVSGVMFMTSLAMIAISRYYWKWSRLASFGVFVPLLIIDAVFLTANSMKLFSGGYVPLILALIMTSIMLIWYWGRRQVSRVYRSYASMTVKEIIKLKKAHSPMIPRSIVFLSPSAINEIDDPVPMLKQVFWDRYNALPQNLLLVNIRTARAPYAQERRFEIHKFLDSPEYGTIYSVCIRFGFMEEKNVEAILHELAQHKAINISDHPSEWLVHAVHERVRVLDDVSVFRKFLAGAYTFMLNNSQKTDSQYGLGTNINLTVAICPVLITSGVGQNVPTR